MSWTFVGIATAALTVALSGVILPADTVTYWTDAVFHTDRIGPLTHPGNFSIGGILATLAAPGLMPAGWWIVGVGLAGVLGLYASQVAERSGHRLLAVAVVGLLSCTVPPLAWGHHWVWSIPLLAVVLDSAVRTSGRARWAWVATGAATYLVVFMWFNAWLYGEARNLSSSYPTYVAAMDAAIDHMTRLDKLVAVGAHPALFVVVAAATVVILARRTGNRIAIDTGPRR